MRPGSDPSRLEAAGVEIARGDMMDPGSLRRAIRVRSVPTGLLRGAGTLLAPVNPMAKDLSAMIEWFQTGRYVADTTLQRQFFGEPPTAEDAIGRFVAGLGHPVHS